MKKTLNKMMLVTFSSIALLGITSCNLDNNKDNKGLTPAEVKVAYESVKGLTKVQHLSKGTVYQFLQPLIPTQRLLSIIFQ